MSTTQPILARNLIAHGHQEAANALLRAADLPRDAILAEAAFRQRAADAAMRNAPASGDAGAVRQHARRIGAKGGSAGIGNAKARSRKQAQAAAKARWAKVRQP
jgi:hypothetical protein